MERKKIVLIGMIITIGCTYFSLVNARGGRGGGGRGGGARAAGAAAKGALKKMAKEVGKQAFESVAGMGSESFTAPLSNEVSSAAEALLDCATAKYAFTLAKERAAPHGGQLATSQMSWQSDADAACAQAANAEALYVKEQVDRKVKEAAEKEQAEDKPAKKELK